MRDTKILCPDGPGRMLFHRSARYSETESNTDTHTHTHGDEAAVRDRVRARAADNDSSSYSLSFSSSLESGVCSLVCIARISRIRISMLLFVVSSSPSSSSSLHVFVTRFCILRLVSVALKFMQHHGNASPSTSLYLASPCLLISLSLSHSYSAPPRFVLIKMCYVFVCSPAKGQSKILTKMANRQSDTTLTETFSLILLLALPNLRLFN